MAHARRIALDHHDSHRSYVQMHLRAWRRRWAARAVALWVMRTLFVTLLVTLVYSVKASAADASGRAIQSLPLVRDAAERFVREQAASSMPAASAGVTPQVFASATEPDPRLQLADCGTALRAFTLNGAALAGKNMVGIRCADESLGAWTLYLSVSLEIERPVLVLRHSLPKDSHIGLNDVESQVRRVPGVASTYPNDTAAVRDQHLKRGAPAGTVLSGDLLTRDLLVKRGQEVSLVFDTGGVAVRAPGVALADGGYSDRVRVQNRTSLKVVEGTIESGNLVRVGM